MIIKNYIYLYIYVIIFVVNLLDHRIMLNAVESAMFYEYVIFSLGSYCIFARLKYFKLYISSSIISLKAALLQTASLKFRIFI